MAGWIKIYRDITNHWIFQDAEKFKWWIDLLIMASHEDYKTLSNGSLVSLKRGQLSVSLSFLSSRWGRSKEKVLNFLRLLESDGMIQRISDRKSTTITICNYDSYQDSLEQTPTANPTDVRPMSDQCPTEYKNVKNVEEINNTNTAHAREGEVVWIASVEQGFAETFKAQGSAIPFARKTGKKPQEVLELLDIYLAMRQLKNKGHRDFNQFVNLFLWSVENNKISIPTEAKKKEPKVISGSDIFNVYGKS
jgi:hypothetical protein